VTLTANGRQPFLNNHGLFKKIKYAKDKVCCVTCAACEKNFEKKTPFSSCLSNFPFFFLFYSRSASLFAVLKI
jgi:hypothetical protein